MTPILAAFYNVSPFFLPCYVFESGSYVKVLGEQVLRYLFKEKRIIRKAIGAAGIK